MIEALILAGGFGTRLREETEFKPKPMVEIGGRPVIWHIMKNLSMQGVSNFVIATGYKGEVIKDYFLNYETRNNDFTVDLGKKSYTTHHKNHEESHWKVTLVDTGESTMTGGRVFSSLDYITGERFLCTYGDGLADIELSKLIRFHTEHNRIATVTTVRPLSRFGVMDVEENGIVSKFREKPQMDDWVNAGFFIFEKKIKEFLNSNIVLEQEPIRKLTELRELAAYRHEGFWQPMDTYRESILRNEMRVSNNAPWRNW